MGADDAHEGRQRGIDDLPVFKVFQGLWAGCFAASIPHNDAASGDTQW